MLKKNLLTFAIIFILLFNIFISSGIAQADFFLIDDTGDLVYADGDHITSNNFCVDSGGDYYIFTWNDTTPYNFTLLKSIDSGDNWVKSTEFDMSSDGNNQPDGISTYIDDDDIIHIAYMYGDGSGFNITYRNYNTDTDTTSIKTHIYGDSNSDDWNGICILKNDQDEIAISWLQSDSSWNNATLRIRIYNDQTETWGDTDIVDYDTTAGDVRYLGLSGDILTNGTFVYSFIRYKTTPTSHLIIRWYDDETLDHGDIFGQPATSDVVTNDNTDISIDNNNDIHVVWERSNGYINYSFFDGTEYNENIMGDNSVCPQISINSDGTVQIVFEFDNGVTPSDWIGGVYGSYGSWSDLQYYNSGITDDMGFPKIVYQNLQDFTKLSDGVIGYYTNTTNSDLYHFDEGYELFYGGGEGQSEGDISSYDYRCSSGSFYNVERLIYPTIENYVDSFGDITIRALELGVGETQISSVSSTESDYTAYINGVSIGSPDYIFQEDAFFYTLQWIDLSVNVGTNDIILEFNQSHYSVVPACYWYNLPLYSTDTARYDGTFGDGIFNGNLFSNNYGLGTCIYYDANTVAPSDNTYEITLLSVDPHWRGNTSSFRVEVTGDESWEYVIIDPNGYIEDIGYRATGNNNFTINHPIQATDDIGEYVFYVLDQDAYPTGLSISTNITFNVSAYGGDVGNWSISAMFDPIVIGDKQGYTFIVPSGYNYRITVKNMDDQDEHILRDGIGFGVLQTQFDAYTIDREGEWCIILYNTSNMTNPLYWDIYRDYFLCTPSLDNYIYIRDDDQSICYTDHSTISGFYTGDIGTIHVVHPTNNSYSRQYTINYGSFSRDFYPVPTERGVALYSVYITNENGDILSWSTGYTINVIDCFVVDEEGGWYGLPFWVPFLIGVFITLFITMSPLIIATYITRNTNFNKVTIPSLLYVGFFFLGLIVSVVMNMLPVWLPFVILFSMIIYFAVQWLYGKKGAIEGE